jgi:hypothetical protein
LRLSQDQYYTTEVKEHTFYITDNNTKQRLKRTVIKVERLMLEKNASFEEAGYA